MYPIDFEADFNPTPNRWTTFFRLILAIPWIIVAYFWGILFLFTHFFAWVAVIILGRYPEWLYDFNAGVIRFGVRFYAWAYLQTDVWPPFGLSDDPTYPIRVNIAPRAAKQSRLKALFRIILVIPLVIITYAFNYAHFFAAVISWLVIVFRGYQPRGVHDMMTFFNGFYARLYGYWALLTDDYPPIGIEKAKGGTALAETAPPAPPTEPPPAAAA
jgi:uncharacterized protein DUF4389